MEIQPLRSYRSAGDRGGHPTGAVINAVQVYDRSGNDIVQHTTGMGSVYDQSVEIRIESDRNNPGMAYDVKMVGNTR